MSDDPQSLSGRVPPSGSPVNASADAADLARQRALADSLALGHRKQNNQPTQNMTAASQKLAGEGMTDSAELLRLVNALKQAESDSGAQQNMVVIGEFSVIASRVPASFISGLQGLTRSESAVLRMLGWGRSNADIAMLLDSAETTVRSHMNNVIRKLELDGMRELMCIAGLLFHPLD